MVYLDPHAGTASPAPEELGPIFLTEKAVEH